MCVEVEMSTEGVADRQDYDARAVPLLSPVLQNSRAYRREIVKQAPILLKDGPEIGVHCKTDTCKWNIREYGCNFPLPSERCSLPAARTSPGLAGMREGLSLSVIGCVYLSPQCNRPAIEHLLEVLADRWCGLCVVPEAPIVGEYLLYSRFDAHLHGSFRR